MKTFAIYDKYGYIVRGNFTSYEAASMFAINRPDWQITTIVYSTKRSTNKQKKAIQFVEKTLDITFDGNLNDFYECSDFLSDYLEEALEVINDKYDNF